MLHFLIYYQCFIFKYYWLGENVDIHQKLRYLLRDLPSTPKFDF